MSLRTTQLPNIKLSLILVGMIILGFALRTVHLNTPIWGDEVASWAFARRTPFFNMLQFSLHDPTPPIYYILTHLVLPLFGTSFVGLRWLSVLFGVLILPTVYWQMREAHFTAKDGLYAVLLTAVSSMLIFYAQEARAYALLAFLGTLSIGFLWRCVQKPTVANSLILAVLVFLLAFTHRSALFLIAAEIALLFFLRRWRPFIFTLIVFVLTILSIFIQIYAGTFPFGAAGDPTTGEAVNSFVATLTSGTVGMQHISKLPGSLGLAFPNLLINELLPIIGVAVLMVVLAIGARKFIRPKNLSEQHKYILMVWFCIIVSGGLGLLAGTPLSPRPQWLLRGLIYIWPLYFIAIVGTTAQSKIRPYLILILVLLNSLSLYAYYTRYTRFDDDIVFEQLSALANEDDLIIADPWYMFEVVNYYYDGQAARAGYHQQEGWIDIVEMAQTNQGGRIMLNDPPAMAGKIFVYYRTTNLAWADLFPDNEIFVYQNDTVGWQLYSQSP